MEKLTIDEVLRDLKAVCGTLDNALDNYYDSTGETMEDADAVLADIRRKYGWNEET
jgi:hypothetical protein